jgi:hypothetical protein
VWPIDVPIMTNCGAAAPSEVRGAFRPGPDAPPAALALSVVSVGRRILQPTPPVLVPTQQLTPTDAEIYPTPGSAPRQVGFGAAIALQQDTAMISMPLYLDNAGRVALFKRDASGRGCATAASTLPALLASTVSERGS